MADTLLHPYQQNRPVTTSGVLDTVDLPRLLIDGEGVAGTQVENALLVGGGGKPDDKRLPLPRIDADNPETDGFAPDIRVRLQMGAEPDFFTSHNHSSVIYRGLK